MQDSEKKIKARKDWVKTYEQLGSVSKAAAKCGIARTTLYRWLERYKEEGFEDRSRKPKKLANKSITDETINHVLDIRDRFHYGKLRIASHIYQHYQIKISPSSVARILLKYDMKLLKRYRKKSQYPIRYAKEIPGERVQVDVCKIDNGIYQYTAVDDCSRYRVMYTYRRRTAKNSIDFLDRLIDQMPFPIQRIQTDRGREFFAYKFQEKLQEYGIKFRPIKPRSPHLNGKVERSHQTDLREFYVTADLKDKKLNDRLEEWQFHYNWHRPHSSLNNKTPIDVVNEKSNLTPYWEDLHHKYDISKEPILEQNYWYQTRISKTKKRLKYRNSSIK